MIFLRACTKVVIILGVYIVGLIPFWIYFVARYFLAPEGFWEHIALIMAWGILLGAIQFWIFIVSTALAAGIWAER